MIKRERQRGKSIDEWLIEGKYPGYILIGKPINSIPEPSFIQERYNLPNRCQKLKAF